MKAHKILTQHKNRAVIDKVAARYAVGVSDSAVSAMQSDDPLIDPVARQYIPLASELDTRDDELSDPIGDDLYSPVRGIVHRYPDRVLLKVTSICPVYCRYCFRKVQVGPNGGALKKSELESALDYIRGHGEIWEVILTGGDPLMLSPARLQAVMEALTAIDHVRIIRIHSRVIAADPERITPELLDVLKVVQASGKMLSVVMHVNHAQEITPDVQRAVDDLRKSGVMMLSQSVLLRGVNDNAAALEGLFRRLVEMGVKPYMLHHLDPAPGTAHFRVSIEEGQALMRDLRGRISGLCLPDYMLDIPGGYGKVPLTPSYCEPSENGEGYEITDYKGDKHDYE